MGSLLTSPRSWQTLFGLGAAGLIGLAAWQSWWPFDTEPQKLSAYEDPSIWQFLLSDRVTLGFIRAGVAALVVYVAVSIPALIAGGRWLRAFGTSGLTADDAQDARKVIADLESELEEVTANFNEAAAQADRLRGERN